MTPNFFSDYWRTAALIMMLALSLSACKKEEPEFFLKLISGDTMGTFFNVHMATNKVDFDYALLEQSILASLDYINRKMSTYDPLSELSRFNRSPSTEWSKLAPETIKLIQAARRISRDTDGAYDVTLGSVINLWGFGSESSEVDRKPSMDTIFDTMNRVGHQLLQVSDDGSQVRKLTSELSVDLSSLAKGHAVDKIGRILEAHNFNRYVVEIGGEIRTRGVGLDGQPWSIGIETPDSSVAVEGYVGLAVENAHIATSGDYRNYREIDGHRFSHIIDGRSGFPVTHNLASVTVLHASTMQADAWATAYMVMGADEAIEHATSKGLAVSLTVKDGENFISRTTPAFDAYLSK